MSKTVHMSLSVRGALKWPARMLKGMFHNEDGSHTTAAESRDRLLDALADGWEVLPMAKCEGFDPKTGCPGHEVTP